MCFKVSNVIKSMRVSKENIMKNISGSISKMQSSDTN